MHSLVIGLGNNLAGADAFGPAVVEHLRAKGTLRAGVDLLDAGTDLLAFLDRFDGRDHVVLVDAVLREGAPRVEIFDEPTLSSWDDRSTGAHAVSPVAAVKLFRRLRAAGVPAFTSPRITLVAYCVGERDFSHPPSPAGVHAGAEAVRTVLSACACP